MSDDQHRWAKEIFLAARRLPRHERSAFVDRACSRDPGIHQEVSSLLAFLDRAAEPPEALSDRPSTAQPWISLRRTQVGNYRLLRKLGEGGMGEVYEAEQVSPIRRSVALKLIRTGMDSDQVVARFESERQALALMDHPAIARVFEAGATEEGRPYFAMEYVPGLPITDFCDRHRLNIRQRLELFLLLCGGVQHAHAKNVIHRDIKPGNVLVTTQDDSPVPKLIDFGVAKAISQRLTERTLATALGQWMGTPDYMSPEQATMGGVEVDGRTDVYSLGVLLYELLAGAQPFDPKMLRESGFDELRRKIREDEPPRPSARLESLGEAIGIVARSRRTEPAALRKRLRGDLDWIVMKALAKERVRRYASAGELALDLRRHLDDEPVEAGPPTTLYRMSKFVRRRRVAFAAGAAAVVALLLGISVPKLWPRQGRSAEAVGEAVEAGPSIAVLPFVNLSDDPADEYFSDGLSEELLNVLAQVPQLRVVAQTSSFAYKGKGVDIRDIGRSLAVASILEGSVRRSGPSLRITAQLIDAKTGFQLWSGSFEREVGEVFAIQDEIARAVTEALKVELLERTDRGGRSAEAVDVHDLYLQGRQRVRNASPEAVAAAIELFQEVIALDPSFAPAYTGLAEGYTLLARRGDLEMAIADRQAGRALQRALELDGQLAEAHAALGLLRSLLGDLDGAEVALQRALELNPSLAAAYLRLAGVLAAQNRGAGADAAIQRALALDPLNPEIHHAIARSRMNRGRFEEGMLRCRRWLRIEPESAETFRLMSLYSRTYGRLDNAVVWGRRAVELEPNAPLNVHELVMAYSGLGEFERAAAWMEHALRLAPNNHWAFSLKAFLYIERGEFTGLEEYTQGLLELQPTSTVRPLPQVERVRLALAGQSKVYQRDYASAVELYERALGEPFTGILELGIDADSLAFLAYAYQQLGRQDEAQAAIEQCLELIHSRQDWIWARLIMPETLAGIYALQGRDDSAMATLEQAVADGWRMRSSLLYAPHFETLRARPDFERLLRQVEESLAEMRERLRRAEGAVLSGHPRRKGSDLGVASPPLPGDTEESCSRRSADRPDDIRLAEAIEDRGLVLPLLGETANAEVHADDVPVQPRRSEAEVGPGGVGHHDAVARAFRPARLDAPVHAGAGETDPRAGGAALGRPGQTLETADSAKPHLNPNGVRLGIGSGRESLHHQRGGGAGGHSVGAPFATAESEAAHQGQASQQHCLHRNSHRVLLPVLD